MSSEFAKNISKQLKARIVLVLSAGLHGQRGVERYRRASLAASAAIVSRGIGLLLGIVSVPLTISYLGPERYGVWLTLSSIFAWMYMTDFGLTGSALVNLVSEAHGKNDRDLARQYVASAFWAILGITTILGVMWWAIFSRIPWVSVFHVSAQVSPVELQHACMLALGLFILMLPTNMLFSIYYGYQDGFLAHLWIIASNSMALVALLVVTRFHGGLVQLVFAISGTRVLVSLVNCFYLFQRSYPWLMPHPSAARWTHVKRLFSLGSNYMLSQIAGVCTYQSQPFVISQILGPSEVPVFVIAQKLLTLPEDLVMISINPLLAPYGEAKTCGDWKWVRSTLRYSVIGSLSAGVTLTLLAAVFARPIIRHWAGPSVVPGIPLIAGLSLYGIICIAVTPTGLLLNGLAHMGIRPAAMAVCAAVTVGLGIVFGRPWGLAGIVGAMVLGVIIVGLAQKYELRRNMRTWSASIPESNAVAAGLESL